MTPGESFTKTWTLKNTGTCQWTSDFDVVFTRIVQPFICKFIRSF
jgi:hypothetical protein